MSHTSVILRCPDEMYLWFEDNLTAGTVKEAMLAVLTEWQASEQGHDARRRVAVAARLGSIFGELLSPLPSLPIPPPPEPARVLPEVRKGTGTKYRKKQHRRRVRR